MITVTADSASALWRDTIDAVLTHGVPASPRGLETWEATDAHLTLTRPRRRLVCVPPDRVINAAFAAAEAVWILAGLDDAWIYTYNQRLKRFADDHILRGAYGPRLRSWSGDTDQLDQARRELLDDPATRRAVIQLWDAARDHHGHRDVPCTLGYQFLLRDGRLDMHTTMRSQDLWLGFCYDIFAATVLHELMAGWLGADLGDYHHHIDSLHLYDADQEKAEAVPDDVVRGPELPDLTVPWDGFDDLLSHIQAGQPVGHPGWDTLAAALACYQLWKGGDRDAAVDYAERIPGPIGEGMRTWYTELATRTRTVAG